MVAKVYAMSCLQAIQSGLPARLRTSVRYAVNDTLGIEPEDVT